MHVTGAERTVTVSQEAIRYAAMYADPNLELFEQEEIPTINVNIKLYKSSKIKMYKFSNCPS